MYRKKYRRLFAAIGIGIILIAIASFSFSSQKSMRADYLAVQNGSKAKATVHRFANEQYREGTKNKYLYTFTAAEDGQTYASSTLHKYSETEIANFYVRYAVDEVDGKQQVRLYGTKDDTIEIDGGKYRLAISYEDRYFDVSRPPDTMMSMFLFALSAPVFLYALYCIIWIFRYKGLETKGILTYAVFVKAYASKAGARRYLAVDYKYKDEDENWVEATSPFAYTAVDAEKLMVLETFKIRYKGKRSMICEDIKNIRL